MENRNRLYLDTVKGITVLLMLWGHCIQYCSLGEFSFFDNAAYRMIYSFHMPLFMLVSGYLYFFSFRKRDLKSLLIHRTQGMVQPIVFGTILYNLMMKPLKLVLSGHATVFDGSLFSGLNLLWFLWCVLASSVAVGVSCKAARNGCQRWGMLLAGAVLVAVFPEKDFQLFMYPFFVVGFFWAKHREKLSAAAGKLKYVSLILFPVMLHFYESRHFIYITPMYSEEYGLFGSLEIDLFRFLIGLAGSAFVLTAVDLLLRGAASKDRVPKLLSAVARLGQNSLQIYCLSAPLLSGYLSVLYQKLVEPFGYNVFARNMAAYNYVFTPLLGIAYAAGLYGVVVLLKKLRIHALIFGR